MKERMNKKTILLIAKDYPPSTESSGVQRTLKFSQYLPEFGWDVQVLTVQSRTYGKNSSLDQLAEIPESVIIKRAFALDTALHLSIKGRYLSWMALPDRWASWVPFAFVLGLSMIIRKRPDVIFSTYPCASAHLVALLLHKVTGIKWVADFRDPMLYRNNSINGSQQKFYQWIEQQTVLNCCRTIFTTPGAIENYAKVRYPLYPVENLILLANGYDENNFLEVSDIDQSRKTPTKPLILLHAGHLYRSERDPSYFFQGLANLFLESRLKKGDLKIVLRSSGNEKEYSDLINAFNLQDIVLLEPAIPYKQALAEMLSVDGLLLFQGSLCNQQIPAKLYEYFRAKKPIFALTDLQGDTANLLRDAGVTTMAPLDDPDKISSELMGFYDLLKAGIAPIASDDFVYKQSRKSRAQQLASLLEGVLLDS
jgi:hypothetical protein